MSDKSKEKIKKEYEKIEKSIIEIICTIDKNRHNLYYEDYENNVKSILKYIDKEIYKIVK